MTPTKKIETILYHTQQALFRMEQGKYDSAALWVCSIDNTAIRWGPPEIKDLATKAWQQIKAGDYEGAAETLDELETLLEELLDEC